ncbi:LuxR C-terminal-related transcriptional regulator [Streptomyces sp. NPDC005805]|uniref:helix-turn-helix transcriptional regulator n=1 Tax=Streptomyces sp. NPDC005805 TaxID=3157068 RepID=UPI0033D6C0FB
MTAKNEASHWPLAGRERELRAFDRAWETPRCRGVVVHGAAGVGKSRLAEEFLARAAGRKWRTARASATAPASAVPLGAVAHLIPDGVDLDNPVRAFSEVATALAGPEKSRWAIWVDDVHLLDATSAVLLRQLMDARVIRLIGTVRTGEAVGSAVQALSDDATLRVDLGPFGIEELGPVLRSILGGPVGQRTLHELQRASGGNMLYLRELIRGALDAGTFANDGEIWELVEDRPTGTPRLAELIRSRLEVSGDDARPALELLAVCGPVSLTDAEAVAPPAALERLERSGLIRVLSDGQRVSVQLAHPLYGELLGTDVPVLRRRNILLQQTERVRTSGARRRDDALHMATWQLAATGTADPGLIVRAAALARHAHQYEQVVRLLEALPDGADTVPVSLLLGEALFELGRWQRAEAVLADAAGRADHDQERLAATLARVWNLFLADQPDRALEIVQSAQSSLTDKTALHLLRVSEGTVRAFTGQPAQALPLLADLEEDAAAAPDINIWVQGALLKADALTMTGQSDKAIAWGEDAYAAHLRLAARALVPHPASHTVVMGLAHAESGRLAEAREAGERALEELTEVRAPLPEVWAAHHLGRTHWLAGRPATARVLFAQAAALARSHAQPQGLRLALGGIAACAAVLGDVEAAAAAAKEARTFSPRGILAGEERLGEAWLLVARGRLAEARATLTEAAAVARSTGHLTSEAVLLTEVARLGGAENVAGRLAEAAESCDGPFGGARADFAAALARDEPAALLAAAGAMERIGAHLLAAEAAAAAAAALRRAGESRKAAAAAQQAHAHAALCEGASTPLLLLAANASVLTHREREIALMASNGSTSKEIAASLHLSVRTVNNHLQNVYGKLGVTTRRDLVQALREGAGGNVTS